MKLALCTAVAASCLGLFAFGAVAQPVTEQTTVETKKPSAGAGVGVVGGAVAGAAVGGPVGAVVGAVAGGVAGAAVDPPAEVKTYVRTQSVPSVTYDGRIAVGEVIPDTVTVYEIPNYAPYRWAYVDNQRVLVDPATHRIVSIINTTDAPVATTAEAGRTVVVQKKGSAGAGVGIVGGAATGAAVGGPVGAVIGGVVGGVAGLAVDPPAKVKTYVRTQQVQPVVYDGPIAVGQVLPETVTVYDIPNYERYRWTYVNHQRILIDRRTRKIVTILNDNE